MATVLEIIQGLSQVAANSYDGAHDEEGNKKETGLRRDEEVAIRDKRVLDGFKIRLHSGNKLCVMYTTEVLLRDVGQKGKYEDELKQVVADIVSFIKKEYRKVTGNSLSLTELKDPPPDLEMIQTSRIRTEAKMTCHYEVGGLEEFQAKDDLRDKRMKASEKFMKQSTDKRPQNDTRKPEKKD
jgi:hypothetical protein